MSVTETREGERDYVLGTHDEEIQRLGLQHRVWRTRATSAWRRAGFTVGQTLLDVGCGPGYGTLDLAEIVGPSGRVTGVDRSRRFLDVAGARAKLRDLSNVDLVEMDLDEGALPSIEADGAWARWVLAFVRRSSRAPRSCCTNTFTTRRGGWRRDVVSTRPSFRW
jgi:ubiquinone/menaquinone biosynthesis C-methylase UbiE